jgi:hypothetical protein
MEASTSFKAAGSGPASGLMGLLDCLFVRNGPQIVMISMICYDLISLNRKNHNNQRSIPLSGDPSGMTPRFSGRQIRQL